MAIPNAAPVPTNRRRQIAVLRALFTFSVKIASRTATRMSWSNYARSFEVAQTMIALPYHLEGLTKNRDICVIVLD